MKILRPEEVTAENFPEFREFTPEETKEALALAKAAFTAADLQRYTELDEGFPVEEVIAEMEETQMQADAKREAQREADKEST
jgi:hypothetical protein